MGCATFFSPAKSNPCRNPFTHPGSSPNSYYLVNAVSPTGHLPVVRQWVQPLWEAEGVRGGHRHQRQWEEWPSQAEPGGGGGRAWGHHTGELTKPRSDCQWVEAASRAVLYLCCFTRMSSTLRETVSTRLAFVKNWSSANFVPEQQRKYSWMTKSKTKLLYFWVILNMVNGKGCTFT